MPAIVDGLRVGKNKDKRIKLQESDKQLIRTLYKTGEYSQRKLAEMFEVSRRTIQFSIDPNKRVANYQVRVSRGGSKMYYDKEKHTEAMAKHRKYKKELMDEV